MKLQNTDVYFYNFVVFNFKSIKIRARNFSLFLPQSTYMLVYSNLHPLISEHAIQIYVQIYLKI